MNPGTATGASNRARGQRPGRVAGARAVIAVDDLAKSYRAPLSGRRVEALAGVSFEVGRGEVFGFLGPNGAGKTTTLRVLMGLIAASRGRASIFGHAVPSRAARQRVGFLPEAPYFYDYLTVVEMLDLAGRLFGMRRAACRARGAELIERVGLSHANGMPIKKYSKGMLQRAGIAQALISDPDLIVLDEPLSGLDPAGRKDVLDIIRELREQGKTVFFSSHILTDVEHVSDRVAILVKGRIRATGTLDELLGAGTRGADVCLALPPAITPDAVAELSRAGSDIRTGDGELALWLPRGADIDAYLARARELDARVISVIPRRDTLEALFIRHARQANTASDSHSGDSHSGDSHSGDAGSRDTGPRERDHGDSAEEPEA